MNLGEVRDATFTLTGAGMWVSKLVHLATNPLTIQERWWVITQAKTEHWVEARGPGHPHLYPVKPQPFKFHHGAESPWDEQILSTGKHAEKTISDHHLNKAQWGQNHEQWQRDQELVQPWLPSPSPDWGFESDQSLVLTASSISSHLDRSNGSQHPHHGRCCWQAGGHMKINLPIFKDEDTKNGVTYQSWRWDLTVYQWAGCWDCTLLPYTTWSLHGYLGGLMRSSVMDITLNNMLTILDKHYNNIKALDALNQELFQLQMKEKETVADWGVHLSRHLSSFPEHFPLDWVTELKCDCFYG